MKEVFISVDIETSGPKIGTHSMLQIGACLVDMPGQTFQAVLQPISNEVDPPAMEVVGKPLSFFVKNGLDAAESMAEFAKWIELQNADLPVFVGFNAAFDWGFVNWYFLTYSGRNPFGVAPLDIKSYYAGLSGVPWSDTRSSRLPSKFQSTTEHKHDALTDAIEQAEVFRKMRASR